MTTQDQTFVIDSQYWSNISNDLITNLFLYRQLLVPVDLNDRIGLQTTNPELPNSNGDDRVYNIVMTIDEADFISDTGPGRRAAAEPGA